MQGLAVDDVELIDKSFVSDELLEFQSTSDKTIPVRMLLYIFQLYDLLFRSSTKGLLPGVFPVALYNGSRRWTVPINLRELIPQEILAKYIPAFEYYPIIERDSSATG